MISSRCSGLSAISNCVRVELTRAHIVKYEGHLHSRLSYNICDVDQLVKSMYIVHDVHSVWGGSYPLQCKQHWSSRQCSLVCCVQQGLKVP